MIVSNSNTVGCQPELGSSILADDFPHFGKRKSSSANTSIESLIIFHVPPFDLSTSAAQFISKIKSFEHLKPNWDSYGAIPPSGDTVEKAVAFVRRADSNLLPVYFVAPGPNGEIVVEFRNGNREASVYFNPDGSDDVILSEGNEVVSEGTLDEDYQNLLSFINA
ncbi:MAG: hypothetical protein LOY03_17115 [Cyclobacteriaceae bacterium]|jgi:hypothetical protein|nr:hypothetical protein [Cyclobacteriaceae bacterium]